MPTLSTSTVTAATDSYITAIADTRQQIEAAQRLRYQVFGKDKGAKLASHAAGLDVDEFDAVMDHLIVSDRTTGEIVGTYRLLPPGRTERLFSEGESDLRGLPLDVRSSLVEAGRACVHPDHRSGAVINLMWAGLARYVLLSGHRYLAGCASVSLADGVTVRVQVHPAIPASAARDRRELAALAREAVRDAAPITANWPRAEADATGVRGAACGRGLPVLPAAGWGVDIGCGADAVAGAERGSVPVGARAGRSRSGRRPRPAAVDRAAEPARAGRRGAAGAVGAACVRRGSRSRPA